MKIFYNMRLLLTTMIIGSLAFYGCKKDNDNDNHSSSATELLSFGPTGAQPGDTIRFFGNNLDKVTEIDFTKATVASSDFISQSKKEILVIVPTETEKGFVTLKTAAGDITSKTQFNIGVAAIVTSITPVARPGENVTIKGDYLNWVTTVAFNDGKVATSFVSQNKNELVVTVPEDAQTGTLVLAYGGTDSSFVETTDTLHVTLPIVTAVSPNPIKHANNVTLTGTDLDLVKQVEFAGVTTPVTDFVSQSATSLVVKIPGATTKGAITVVAASGVSTTSGQQLDLIMPAIMSLSPNTVSPEMNLTITGTNLDLIDSIAFQNVKAIATFASQSATQIVVKVPKGLTEGKLTLSVKNSTVKITSSMDLILVKPAVATMSPNPIDPETNLTITGTNLNLVTGISFVGATAPVTIFESQSATKIVVKVPKGTLKGKITLSVLNSTLKVESTENLVLNGGLPPLADFPFAIYTDATENGFGDWSYTDTHDFNNTSNVRQGTKSILAVYRDPAIDGGGYQGVTFHNDNGPATTPYSKLEFSVFGEAGTGGKKLNIIINGNYTNPPQATIVEGEWTTFSFNLSDLGSPAKLTEVALQSAGWGGTIHIDHVGLR